MQNNEEYEDYQIGNLAYLWILPLRIILNPQSPTLAIFRVPFFSSIATILLREEIDKIHGEMIKNFDKPSLLLVEDKAYTVADPIEEVAACAFLIRF